MNILWLALVSPASAGDLLFFVQDDGTVRSYDEQGNHRGDVSLSNGVSAAALAPSRGGRWLYAADRFGYMHWINPMGLGTSQGSSHSLPGYGSISASADRRSVYYGANNLYALKAANLSLIGQVVSAYDITQVAAHPTDTLVSVGRQSKLYAYNTLTWSPWPLATAPHEIVDVTYTGDGEYALAIYRSEAGSEVTGCSVLFLSCTTASVLGSQPQSVAADGRNRFYVATEAGVTAFLALSNGFSSGPFFGSPYPVDVAVAADGDVYVLYDDHIEAYDSLGRNGRILASFPPNFVGDLVVVPERESNGLCQGTSCIRTSLAALFDEASVRRLPIWWEGEPVDCSDCSAEELESAVAQAKEYLDVIGTESLSVAQTRAFLEKVHDIDAAEADWALDDELIHFEK